MSRPARSPGRSSLEQRLLEVIALQNAIVAAQNNLEEVLSIVVSRAPELTGADAGVVEFREGDEMVYRAVSGTAEPFRGLRLRVDESLSGLAVTEGRVQRCDDAATDPRVDRLAAEAVGAISMLCIPLQDSGRVLGVLKLYAGREGAFDADDERIAGLLTQVIGTHLGLAVPSALGGREAYEQRLAKEVARATRYDRRLSVVRFAFDPAAAGPEETTRITNVITAVRGGDQPFRLGPGEFAVLLPETDEAGAERMASRVAAAAGAVPLAWGAAERAGGGPRDLHARAGAGLQR
jgi:GAF domain-containing protein